MIVMYLYYCTLSIYPCSTANPLGIAIAFLASPHLVVQSPDVFTLSWVYLIPAGVGVVLTVLTFWRNRPPTPPSLAAEHKQDSFFKGVKTVCECMCECMCLYVHMYQSAYLCVCMCVCVHLCTPLLFSLFPSPFPSHLSPFSSTLSLPSLLSPFPSFLSPFPSPLSPFPSSFSLPLPSLSFPPLLALLQGSHSMAVHRSSPGLGCWCRFDEQLPHSCAPIPLPLWI